ncbi:ATPAse AAA+ type core protein [Apiospora hydei]|uniref:ATPAse AAA+ type core protein n=1 Tax=Apiospora hydei TaxID=1337664 RepID=A0ABR1UWD3_9PEZI
MADARASSIEYCALEPGDETSSAVNPSPTLLYEPLKPQIHTIIDEFQDLLINEGNVSGSGGNDPLLDDFIVAKGTSLLMVLVGHTGLDKTLANEAVAEKAQQPLYALGASDLGRRPLVAEPVLKEALGMGANWDAVLLLDERDMFLQRRCATWREQNAIIASHIMRTNCADAINHAFKSRIYLTLWHPNLSTETKSASWKHWRKIKNIVARPPSDGLVGQGAAQPGAHGEGSEHDDGRGHSVIGPGLIRGGSHLGISSNDVSSSGNQILDGQRIPRDLGSYMGCGRAPFCGVRAGQPDSLLIYTTHDDTTHL